MRRSYVIKAPKYAHNSAGIRVLYKLCDKLKSYGENASVLTEENTIKDENIVAIYPEIYKGNPLKAKHVARYVLYHPGVLGGDSIYDDKEMVFSYSKVYLPSIKNEVKGLLFLPIIEREIFYDRGLERKGSCYTVGKGIYRAEMLPPNCICITRGTPPTREGLAKLFNQSTEFYCFDPSTALIHEAALCGCPTVFLAPELYGGTEFGTSAVVRSIENIDQARKTLPQVREKLDQFEKDFEIQLKHFIEVTQS